MVGSTVTSSYVQSLLWVATLFAVIFGVTNIVELLFIDFIHGNTHRTQANALQMMLLFTPLFGVTAIIGSFLVFSLPLSLQAMTTGALIKRFGPRAQVWALLALPFAAIVTWYCYDYLTPSNFNLGINLPADWTPYQHGLSLPRYLRALGVQAPITLFSLLYCKAAIDQRSRTPLVAASLALAIIAGGILGYRSAELQFQFL